GGLDRVDVHAAPRLAGAPAPDGRVLRGVRRDHGDPGAQGSLVRLPHARRLLLRVRGPALAVAAVNVLPMCSLTWLDRYNDQQKDRRELALAEVSEAKAELEATLAENAGLHQ